MHWSESFHQIVGSSASTILWWQMVIRGLIIFIYGVILLRLLGRRIFSQQTPLDIVVSIVVGSNLSRAMTANAPLLTTMAATAAIVIVFWVVAHGTARSSFFSHLVKGSPICLMRAGKLDERQLLKTGISRADISESARLGGAGGIEALGAAVYERNGKISTLEAGDAL